MKALKRFATATILAALAVPAGVAQGKPATPAADASAKAVVGPNILVSRDGNVPHVEVHSAVNPKNSKNMITAAITLTGLRGDWATKVYSTQDGGMSWMDVRFPEPHETSAFDPQVSFGIHGTAYHATLNVVKDESGASRARLLFYRSEDGGRTWNKPTDLGVGNDHEMIAVDRTLGQHAGRIYITTLNASDYPVYRIRVFRSDDDGRTFIGPVEAANGGGKLGINTVTNIVVLRDGTLVIAYLDFDIDPAKTKKVGALNLFTVSSSDGGVTFTQPAKVGVVQYDIAGDETRRIFTVPVVAADVSSAHPDRVYLAWSNFQNGKYRMVLSSSDDKGRTWSAPAEIDRTAPGAHQYQPAIAVNKDGVVVVTWFDSRHSTGGWRYDQYAAASTDGGQSFLPAVRVSSESSNPAGEGNQAMIPSALVMKGKLTLGFTSAYSRWAAGGDYMGLSPDANGIFHSFWADSRSGTFQVMSANISVDLPGKRPAAALKEVAKKESDITPLVEIMFGSTRYDAATKILDLPVVLKNTSKESIYGPVRLDVPAVGGVYEWENAEEDKQFAPQILNASNQKTTAGAQFDFTPALGTDAVLRPGAISSPVVLRLKLVDPTRVPTIELKVRGEIETIR